MTIKMTDDTKYWYRQGLKDMASEIVNTLIPKESRVPGLFEVIYGIERNLMRHYSAIELVEKLEVENENLRKRLEEKDKKKSSLHNNKNRVDNKREKDYVNINDIDSFFKK